MKKRRERQQPQRLPVLSQQPPLLQSPFTALEVLHTENQEEGTEKKDTRSLKESLAKTHNRLILRKEKAHRAGKTILVVSGFCEEIGEKIIESLAKEAKMVLGCGGTVMGREIELQGYQVERVKKFFASKGFQLRGPS